jgi:hypothetical protein
VQGLGGIFRAKVPRIGTLLRKLGLGLKLAGSVLSALIGPVLSLDQVIGGSLLK